MKRTRTSIACFILLATCLFASCSVGHAQTKTTVAQKTESPVKSAQQPVAPKNTIPKQQLLNITDQRRIELIRFVRKHHPEILRLLVSLEKTRPTKFQAAVRTLDREVKNLQALEKRAPERYKKSLELWICKSKIELLTAQLVVKKTDEKAAVRSELKSLIARRYDLRIALLADETDKAKERLNKLQKQIKTLRATRGKLIQDQLAAITRNAERILAAEEKAAVARKKKAADAKKKRSNNK